MKLLFCPKCQDVLKLADFKRECECGKSFGYYTDSVNAVVGGKAIPVGFANYSFIQATKEQPEEGLGKTFEAFVIPKYVPSITRVK